MALSMWVSTLLGLALAEDEVSLAQQQHSCTPAMAAACESVCDLVVLDGCELDLRGALLMAAAFPRPLATSTMATGQGGAALETLQEEGSEQHELQGSVAEEEAMDEDVDEPDKLIKLQETRETLKQCIAQLKQSGADALAQTRHLRDSGFLHAERVSSPALSNHSSHYAGLSLSGWLPVGHVCTQDQLDACCFLNSNIKNAVLSTLCGAEGYSLLLRALLLITKPAALEDEAKKGGLFNVVAEASEELGADLMNAAAELKAERERMVKGQKLMLDADNWSEAAGVYADYVAKKQHKQYDRPETRQAVESMETVVSQVIEAWQTVRCAAEPHPTVAAAPTCPPCPFAAAERQAFESVSPHHTGRRG